MQWSRTEIWVGRSVVGIVLLLAILAIWFSIREAIPESLVVGPDKDVRLPIANFGEGELVWVTYQFDAAAAVGLAIQRGEHGVFRVALASCPSCYGYRHYVLGNRLMCGRCRRRMRLPDPGQKLRGKGGCVPVPLAYSQVGSDLIVTAGEIREQFTRWLSPGTARSETTPGTEEGRKSP